MEPVENLGRAIVESLVLQEKDEEAVVGLHAEGAVGPSFGVHDPEILRL